MNSFSHLLFALGPCSKLYIAYNNVCFSAIYKVEQLIIRWSLSHIIIKKSETLQILLYDFVYALISVPPNTEASTLVSFSEIEKCFLHLSLSLSSTCCQHVFRCITIQIEKEFGLCIHVVIIWFSQPLLIMFLNCFWSYKQQKEFVYTTECRNHKS